LNDANVNNKVSRGNAQPAPSPSVKPEQKILWDFRKRDLGETQEIPEAETRSVLKYILGDESDSGLKITNRVSGSFTKPNVKETLYYMTGCQIPNTNKFITDCPNPAANSEGWIAIYDGTIPVLKIHEGLGKAIVKVTDINDDGINEILSVGGYDSGGYVALAVHIGQISGSNYKQIKGFDGNLDTCSEQSTITLPPTKALVLSYVPTADHKMPVLTEEYFQS